ncbi:MAG: rhomboid family intramembrane serine protease [Planctomycetes bacterium]|nr:rhomboid family intramembrane serine protease [Planctomycetota bacterium]
MFIPIGDENPRERTPYVTYALVALNILLFLLWCFPERTLVRHLPEHALWPMNEDWSDPGWWKSVLTSMFMHANILHILGNMIFLWIFGDNVEDKLGHLPFLAFYLLSGIAGSALHVVTTERPDIPTLGASGAVSGVLGAYVVFFPRHKVRMLVWLWFFIDIYRIPAFWWIGFWVFEQLLLTWANTIGIATTAHIGGFVVGLAWSLPWKYLLFPPRFGLAHATPEAPLEFLISSRMSDRVLPAKRVPASSDEADLLILEDAKDRFAVLRSAPELTHLREIGAIVSSVTSEPAGEVRDRMIRTRGVIVRGVPQERAERIQWELHRAGMPSLLIPDIPATQPPRPLVPERLSWNELELAWTIEGAMRRTPWSAPFLALGALVNRTALVDVFLSRSSAIRATRSVELSRRVDGHGEESASLSMFAADLLDLRDGTVVNEGVRGLATRGAWGWLAFTDAKDYDDYVFWAYNVVRAKRSVFRF